MKHLTTSISLLIIGIGSCIIPTLYANAEAPIARPKTARMGHSADSTINYVQQYADTLVKMRADYDRLLLQWDDIFLQLNDLHMDANYYKLATPATYYAKAFEQASSIDGWKPLNYWQQEPDYSSVVSLPDLEVTRRIDRQINKQLLSFYVQYPALVVQNDEKLKTLDPLALKYKNVKDQPENILKLMQVSEKKEMSEGDLMVYKPNFWTTVGNGYLQFSQNAISDNWYKGGESTISFLSGLTLQANYDDKQNVQWENKFEWKLGFITAPSDSLHAYRANNDLLRIGTKLGYKAMKNWYYTVSAEFKTQVFSNYAPNSNNLVSSLLSPAELNIGLGMDFKYIRDGKANLSVLMNPFNYTRYSVLSDEVDPTKFNIDKGKKVANILGSRVEATLKWKLMKSLMWESRFSYITNYNKVVSEWENTFNFNINKYLSTKLFLHARFDDGLNKKGDWGYVQYQELLSFGLNYAW